MPISGAWSFAFPLIITSILLGVCSHSCSLPLIARFDSSATTSELAAKEPEIFTGSEFRNIDDDVPLAQFAVAFDGASWTDPNSTTLMVMQAMLGAYTKGSSGRKHMGRIAWMI
ncbi:hypothetical protein POM88_017701 [Heracleum sosnowskyi]|uniref:Peptidase M16 C-terminal domain-containing protein n=1 Tax=Heracleum sosnowskyi TaxID=360622 RepID=A0AAD8MZN5_9APIA|nr:hypothetical protein POM88_017701 [Heracleum sosnowskyi]